MPRLTPSPTLPEQAADQLRDRIAAGEFPIGTLLPGEVALAAEMGVSRNTLREALRSLVHAGMLGARPGYGTFVVATSDIAPALARRVDRDTTADVEQVRAILEREGARLAAVNATQAQLADLREALDTRGRAVGGAAYAAADLAFHRILMDASGNALLAELYRGVGGNEQALVHLDSEDLDITTVPELAAIDRAHDAIVDAIEARDPEAAVRAADHTVDLVHALAQGRR